MLKYVRILCDMSETVDELSDAEAGRLLKAVLHYGMAEAIDPLSGREVLVFKMLKRQIDQDQQSSAENAQRSRQNGAKGGRPKKPSGFSKNPEKPSGFSKNPENPEKPNINIEDDDISRALEDNQTILAAAEKAGFPTTGAVADALIDLYSLHGLEKVLAGIKSCVDHSALNLAYLKACMQDKPRVSAPDGDPGKKYGWL